MKIPTYKELEKEIAEKRAYKPEKEVVNVSLIKGSNNVLYNAQTEEYERIRAYKERGNNGTVL